DAPVGHPVITCWEQSQQFAYSLESGLFCLVMRFSRNDDDGGIALSAAIDTAKALYHPLPRDEVADGVVGVDVDTDFSRCRGNDEGGARQGGAGLPDEPVIRQPSGNLLPFEDASCADDKLDVDRGRFARQFRESFPCLQRLLAAMAIDEDTVGNGPVFRQ